MKKRKSVLTLLTVIFLLTAGWAMATTESLTVAEWQKITKQRKVYFVMGSMEAQQQKGVVFHHTMDEIIAVLDQEVSSSQDRSGQSMDTLFSEVIQKLEAESKADEDMDVL